MNWYKFAQYYAPIQLLSWNSYNEMAVSFNGSKPYRYKNVPQDLYLKIKTLLGYHNYKGAKKLIDSCERLFEPETPEDQQAILDQLYEEGILGRKQAQRQFDIALRQGDIDQNGAYFSTPGMSTYFDEANENINKYNLSNCNIADTHDMAIANKILTNALNDPTNRPEDQQRIQEAIDNKGYIDYLLNDEVPSVVNSAKKLGYDGIVVWENDDVGEPTSVFIWNIAKIQQL